MGGAGGGGGGQDDDDDDDDDHPVNNKRVGVKLSVVQVNIIIDYVTSFKVKIQFNHFRS